MEYQWPLQTAQHRNCGWNWWHLHQCGSQNGASVSGMFMLLLKFKHQPYPTICYLHVHAISSTRAFATLGHIAAQEAHCRSLHRRSHPDVGSLQRCMASEGNDALGVPCELAFQGQIFGCPSIYSHHLPSRCQTISQAILVPSGFHLKNPGVENHLYGGTVST